MWIATLLWAPTIKLTIYNRKSSISHDMKKNLRVVSLEIVGKSSVKKSYVKQIIFLVSKTFINKIVSGLRDALQLFSSRQLTNFCF